MRKPAPRRFRIRRCNGNTQAWMIAAIRANGEESDSYGSFTTGLTLDILLARAAYLKLTPADQIEFVAS